MIFTDLTIHQRQTTAFLHSHGHLGHLVPYKTSIFSSFIFQRSQTGITWSERERGVLLTTVFPADFRRSAEAEANLDLYLFCSI